MLDTSTIEAWRKDAEDDTMIVTSGIVAGTMVATESGWRPVEKVAAGDLVLTFDEGLRPVRHVRRRFCWSAEIDYPESLWPLFVPAGALGNKSELYMLPNQNVMIESDAAEDIWGDPFAVVPAAALDGYRGIARVCPMGQLEVITLHFDLDQIVFANVGALFFCQRASDLISDALSGTAGSRYPVLPAATAEALLEQVMLDEEAAAASAAVPFIHTAPLPERARAAA